MRKTTLTLKQNILIDSLNTEDRQWFENIVNFYKTMVFEQSFPMTNIEQAKQSFFRLYLLREMWYEVLTYAELEDKIVVSLKLS